MTAETQPQMVARLLKNGGFILVVGGNLEDQLSDKFKKHPQIMVWDDVRQGTLQKQIPANTRAIAWNRYISHPMVGRLRDAASQLRCPIFPMLKPREMRELLSEVVPADAVPTEVLETINVEITVPDKPSILTKEQMLRKPRHGEMSSILAQELLETETPTQGVKRLISTVREKYGIKLTEKGLEQAIRRYRWDVQKGKKKSTNIVGQKKKPTEDAFAEGERLLNEAKTAIDLFLEFLPKLREERNEMLERQRKLKEMLG